MNFLLYPNGDYYQWNIEKMRAYNIRGGWFAIDENVLGECKNLEFEDWHDLYIHTFYNPLVEDMKEIGWIAPNGDFYPCTAHEVEAKIIVKYLFGNIQGNAADYLNCRGWIKVSATMMWEFYIKDLEERFLPFQQRIALLDWCKTYNMPFPQKI